MNSLFALVVEVTNRCNFRCPFCVSLDGATPESYRAGRHVIGIRANGDVLPCLSLGHQFIEDNLRRRPLVEIWNDPNSFAQFRHKEENLTGPCAKCPFGSRCKAGCSAMAVSQTGTLTETPFCIRQLETERIIKEMTG